MKIFLLIVFMNVNSNPVPVVQHRTLSADECQVQVAAINKKHGPIAFCAVEELIEGWSL